MIIYLVGLPDPKKSILGRQFADAIGFNFGDTDEALSHTTDDIMNKILNADGDSGLKLYRQQETNHLRKLSRSKDIVISTGGGVPCVDQNMNFMNNHGVTIFLNPSIDSLVDKQVTLDQDVKNEVREMMKDMDDKRFSVYMESKHMVTGDITIDDLQTIFNEYP